MNNMSNLKYCKINRRNKVLQYKVNFCVIFQDKDHIDMNFKKLTIVLITLIETLLFGGLLLGWSSLVYVLKEEGLFENLCDHHSNNGNLKADLTPENSTNITNTTNEDISESKVNIKQLCTEQDTQLNFIFSIALSIGNVCTVFIGIADNRLGTKMTRTLFASGSMLLAFTSKENPWLLLPGLFFIAIGGFCLLMTNIHISFILNRGSTVYIGIISGCFDGSATVQWVIKKKGM
ncbi:hypothetical protein KUTeg_017664 [Tegillarca granosa]|uniref:Uncharacterized protein n=1 Tax=Tegillarca granosa TaxID=220873 RepID=A0ABQ9EI30_TEGGR|nr:hypothetical protein KUTeg_017664 [Tegillarca granosa]